MTWDGMREVSSEAELRELLGTPLPRAVSKERCRLHERDKEWLAASPLCLIATAGADGSCDVSPKGDPPGFTQVLDDTTIAIGEATGGPTGSATSWPTRAPACCSWCRAARRRCASTAGPGWSGTRRSSTA